MKKTLAELVDELSITNVKIFHLVDKVQKNAHTVEDAKKLQDLNSYRSKLMNAISDKMDEDEKIKI